MFKQIVVAMAGAIAAQLTAATLDLSPAERHAHFEPHASPPSAVVIRAPQDFFVIPSRVATMAPFPGASQVASRQ